MNCLLILYILNYLPEGLVFPDRRDTSTKCLKVLWAVKILFGQFLLPFTYGLSKRWEFSPKSSKTAERKIMGGYIVLYVLWGF